MILPKLSGAIAYGGDYNPEQWPESVWIEDVALMKLAGVNIVSLGIFSWTKLQPAPDQWDFAWLDRIMDLLAENNIFVCLATATASPPAWLVAQHPSVLPVNAEGQTLHPGSRQHYSPSSSEYRKAVGELVKRLADRYANHPAVAAWHVNNEYACHMQECHNEESTAAFRMWLKRKYTTLEALNKAWGTAFWSQIYTDWEQIYTPRKAPYFNNPTQQLDFQRFTSDAFLELYLLEKCILRERNPELPITTNFMGFFKPLDYHRWAEELDFTAWDNYPDPIDEKAGRELHAAGNDLTRSFKPGLPFVLMEQATSAVNWRDINRPKRPGLMRLHSYQTIARGGDGVMFFQWRASFAGTEKFHSAMVQHCGAKDSRVFGEVSQLGSELKKISSVSGSTIHAEVAILFDWHSWWSVEVDSRPGRIDYSDWARRVHTWFYEKNIAVDFIAPHSERIGEYKVVIAPALYLLSDADAQRIDDFVQTGGAFLATYFSAISDENDHVQLGGYPAKLRSCLGLWVEEWCPYAPEQRNLIRFQNANTTAECDHWCDLLHLETAKELACFEKDFFRGRAAFTRNDYGKGKAFYLATRPDANGLDRVLSSVCSQANITPLIETPAGVEAALRRSEDSLFLFLLNHSDDEQIIPLLSYHGIELLSERPATDAITLAPLDVAVIRCSIP